MAGRRTRVSLPPAPQADGQGRARISFDINRAAVGVLVNVEVTAHLQDAPVADCATTFTPVAATRGDPNP